MEVTKRTYQKHKTEKKITVKHYVNTTICEFDERNSPIYPIYLEVIYDKKTTRFRSHLTTSQVTYDFNGEEYYNFDLGTSDNPKYVHITPDSYLFDIASKRDIHTVKSIIKEQSCFYPEEFSINVLPKLYHSNYYSLSFFVDWCLKSEIKLGIDKIKSNKGAFLFHVPFTEKTSSLNHLLFFRERYPEFGSDFDSIKSKYSSKIWYLDMFLGMMEDLYYADHWDESIRLAENIYASYNLSPTLYDFEDGYFSKTFMDCFHREKSSTKKILIDIERLRLKHYHEFQENVIKKQIIDK